MNVVCIIPRWSISLWTSYDREHESSHSPGQEHPCLVIVNHSWFHILARIKCTHTHTSSEAIIIYHVPESEVMSPCKDITSDTAAAVVYFHSWETISFLQVPCKELNRDLTGATFLATYRTLSVTLILSPFPEVFLFYLGPCLVEESCSNQFSATITEHHRWGNL